MRLSHIIIDCKFRAKLAKKRETHIQTLNRKHFQRKYRYHSTIATIAIFLLNTKQSSTFKTDRRPNLPTYKKTSRIDTDYPTALSLPFYPYLNSSGKPI